MTEAFGFTEGSRTYTCSAEARAGGRSERWWWFQVSGDRHRYAPFHADATDSPLDVRQRIVNYYDELLERRGLPPSAFPRR